MYALCVIWRCEHRRFCVEVCMRHIYIPFIHSFTPHPHFRFFEETLICMPPDGSLRHQEVALSQNTTDSFQTFLRLLKYYVKKKKKKRRKKNTHTHTQPIDLLYSNCFFSFLFFSTSGMSGVPLCPFCRSDSTLPSLTFR